ncbi:MAG: DNA polymerase I [Clostridia bacterium]|nr:DNA polymerase I [Clostridia bacterium]
MKKLLVVDGNSIINRAFYGVRPLSTRDGRPTNAIYGTVNIINRQLTALSPDYAAVCFDVHAPTFRHELYPEYKAGRRPTPPDLLAQFDACKAVLRAMGLNVLEKPGYEADDLQGTLARMAGRAGVDAYILSGDRDLLQLIDPQTTVLLAGNSDTVPFDAEAFQAKYGIPVERFIDLKAMMGDSSDNIPGIPGVGEKTAVKLLCDYGTLDEVLTHGDDPALSPALRKKIVEGRDSALLSRTLAKIDTDVPLGITLDDVERREIDNDALYRLFLDLEFTAFIRQFKLEAPKAPAKPKKEIPTGTIPDLFDLAGGQTEAAEDESEDAPVYSPVSAADAVKRLGKRFAVEGREDGLALSSGEENLLVKAEEIASLSPLFADEGREIVCFDAKKLMHRLSDAGVGFAPIPLDLLLYAYLLRPGEGQSSVRGLALTLLGKSAPDDAPTAHLALALEPILREKVRESGEEQLLDEVELPLIPVLFSMERTGFGIDRAGMVALGETLDAEAKAKAEKISELAGHPFNILSPKQLGTVLFEELGLKGGKKTKTGYSTGADVLEGLRYAHPIVGEILAYRQLTKLHSTYAVGLLAAADENDRIHTDFKQAQTATGRLSSAEPNLQNIPVRTELGRLFRRLFVAPKGRVLVDADYSQIELRLLAHVSGDETMLAAFHSGADVHTSTAASVFHVPEELVTPEMRKRAKAVNFGIMYGIGPFSLSQDLGIPMREAKEYIETYKAHFTRIGEYLEKTIADATETGYTETIFRRRRYIPELRSPNKMTQAFGRRIAMNAPIQGSSADIMKIAMIRVFDRLKREIPSARLVMQVHDELIVECDQSDMLLVSTILRDEMQGAANLSLPLTVDVEAGKSWDG